MKIWLDDVREPPEGWLWALCVDEFIAYMQFYGDVTHASLDHDLGDFASQGGDGSKATDWMAEHSTWPSEGLRVHSMNPVGRWTMLATIDRYGPFQTGYGVSRGEWDE